MGTKPWWKSQTIWAGLVSIVAGTVPLIDQNFGTNIASSPFFGIFMSIVGGLVIHGRATTTSTVTMSGPTIPPSTGG